MSSSISLRADVLPVFIGIAAIQGLPVAGMLVASTFLAPDLVGLLRWLEAVLATLLIIVTWGLPSLLVRMSSLARSPEASFSLLVGSCGVGLAATTLVLLCGWAAREEVAVMLPASADLDHLLLASLILVPALCVRMAFAILQGSGGVRSVSTPLFYFGIAAGLSLVASTYIFKANGWVMARIATEAVLAFVLCGAIIRKVYPARLLSLINKSLTSSLFREGVAVNYSIVARTVADNLAMFLFGFSTASGAQLGFLGFVNLLMFIPLLNLGVVCQASIPRLVGVMNGVDSEEKSKVLKKFVLTLIAPATIWLLASFLFSVALADGLVFADYAEAGVALAIFGLCVPLKAALLAAGAINIATARYSSSAALAGMEIAVISSSFFLFQLSSATDVAFVVLGSLVLPTLFSMQIIRRAIQGA